MNYRVLEMRLELGICDSIDMLPSNCLLHLQTFEEHLIFCCINSQIFPNLNWKTGSIQLITENRYLEKMERISVRFEQLTTY